MAEPRHLTARKLWDETGAVSWSGPGSGTPDRTERAKALDRAIELQIVPRLVLANIWRCRDLAQPATVPAVSADVIELGDRLLSRDDVAALEYVRAKLAAKMPLDDLYIELLAPTARYLGDLWDIDACDFAAVTLGLYRLHRILRELDSSFVGEAQLEPNGLPVLLVPTPGEQHMFGLALAAEFFRRAGWNVWSSTLISRNELGAMVRDEWFAVIGFSLSCESRLEALAAAIQLARRESCNRRIGVLVGGRTFAEHPDLVARVGADAMAADARQAPQQAQSLVAALAQRN